MATEEDFKKKKTEISYFGGKEGKQHAQARSRKSIWVGKKRTGESQLHTLQRRKEVSPNDLKNLSGDKRRRCCSSGRKKGERQRKDLERNRWL